MTAEAESGDAAAAGPGAAPHLEDAAAWIDAALARTGAGERTGAPVVTRERPWGTVLAADATGGRVWLKVPAAATRFEVGLYDVLARVAPDRVLVPLAMDVDRGWLLLPDGGPSLAERHADDLAARRAGLEAALPRYAELQRAVAPHVDALLAAGVADLRPATLPARLDEALTLLDGGRDAKAGSAAEPGGPARRAAPRAADAEVRRAIEARRPELLAAAEALAAGPGGASVDHNDLHAGNLLPDAGLVAYDWGDAVVAHPFASLLVPLGATAHELGCDPDDPRVTRLRDAYLEAWSDLAPHAELVATAERACRVGQVARALVWHRAGGGDPGYDGAARAALTALTRPSPFAMG